MGNRSYLNVWYRELPEAALLPALQGFLATVPVSSSRPGFTQLTIRAVSHAEPPLIEHDLRRHPLDAAQLAAAVAEILHADVCYEVEAHWDLWSCDAEHRAWRLGPQRLEIICQGEEYDDGAWVENGHFCVDLGFEHLFTAIPGRSAQAPAQWTSLETPRTAASSNSWRNPAGSASIKKRPGRTFSACKIGWGKS